MYGSGPQMLLVFPIVWPEAYAIPRFPQLGHTMTWGVTRV